MLYFAYGSNLSIGRLAARVPSASLLCLGRLPDHCLLFHKIGRDGSAKCDAFYTGLTEDFVLGAVYRIDPEHRRYLDAAEGCGNGYEAKEVAIHSVTGEQRYAFTYYATSLDPDIKPFHWYKEHVLRGVREHGFPELYIRKIEGVVAVEDHDRLRAERELGIYREAG